MTWEAAAFLIVVAVVLGGLATFSSPVCGLMRPTAPDWIVNHTLPF